MIIIQFWQFPKNTLLLGVSTTLLDCPFRPLFLIRLLVSPYPESWVKQCVLLLEQQKCTPPSHSSGNPQLFMSLPRRWETSSGPVRLHGQVLMKTRHSYPPQPFTFPKMKAKPHLCVIAVSSARPLKSSGHYHR